MSALCFDFSIGVNEVLLPREFIHLQQCGCRKLDSGPRHNRRVLPARRSIPAPWIKSPVAANRWNFGAAASAQRWGHASSQILWRVALVSHTFGPNTRAGMATISAMPYVFVHHSGRIKIVLDSRPACSRERHLQRRAWRKNVFDAVKVLIDGFLRRQFKLQSSHKEPMLQIAPVQTCWARLLATYFSTVTSVAFTSGASCAECFSNASIEAR